MSGLNRICGGFVFLLLSFSVPGFSQDFLSGIPTTADLKLSWQEVKIFVGPLTKLLFAQSDRIKKLESQVIILEIESSNYKKSLDDVTKSSQEWKDKYETSEKDRESLKKNIEDLSQNSLDLETSLKNSRNEVDIWRGIAIAIFLSAAGYVAGDLTGLW